MTRLLNLSPFLLLLACGTEEKDSSTATMTDTIHATGWGDNVAITTKGDSFIYASDGYPNHVLNDEYIMPDDASPTRPPIVPTSSRFLPRSWRIR